MPLTSEQRVGLKNLVSQANKKKAKKAARIERLMEAMNDQSGVSKNGYVFGEREVPTKRRVIGMGFTCMWEGCDEPVNSDRGMACYCTRLQENGQTHRQMNAAKRGQPRVVEPPLRPDVDDDVIVGAKDDAVDWEEIANAATKVRDMADEVDEVQEALTAAEVALSVARLDLWRLTDEARGRVADAD